MQSPLPEGLDERAAPEHTCTEQDVEAVNLANLGLVLQGREILALCTARSGSCPRRRVSGGFTRRRRRGGGLFGYRRPLSQLLLSAGATVTTCHIDTKRSCSAYHQSRSLNRCGGQGRLRLPRTWSSQGRR